uniref:TRAF-interacting protein with FHA domain-containing protein B n=1 Tax=Odobenus rosmarus divergens TaxID=9708 RepID=UPI00063CD60B|nr:PREDICTED: TRAF-interacting protein with FHA domain-containing protein B [Odobenus rosmarus divergens]
MLLCAPRFSAAFVGLKGPAASPGAHSRGTSFGGIAVPVRPKALRPQTHGTLQPVFCAPQLGLLSTERALTVLHVSLHHPAQDPDIFANVPAQLQHDTSPLLVGRSLDAHLRLQLPCLSRRHLSLEPYREKGSALLTFCLKALSRKGCVWVNGLTLRFLEQVPLSMVNRVAFSGIQMVVRIEGGTSLEAFVCCFHLSPSPLIHRPQAEETDEWESTSQEQPPPSSGHWAPGHLGLLHGPSLPSPGGGAETQL